MNVESNKSVVHSLFDEIWNGRQFDAIDELDAPDYVADYRQSGGPAPGRRDADTERNKADAAPCARGVALMLRL